MMSVLAADTSASGWNTFVPPMAVILGALIAGFVAWRNAKQSAYDRLATLVSVHQNWPEDADGKDTVDRSIALALAEIRRREGQNDPAATQSEADADHAVTEKRLRRRIVSLVTLFVGILITSAGVLPSQSGPWTLWAASVGVGLTVVAVTSLFP